MASIGEQQFWAAVGSIARSLNSIGQDLKKLVEDKPSPPVDPESLGALALWREDVAKENTILGFTEWLAWQEEKRGDQT